MVLWLSIPFYLAFDYERNKDQFLILMSSISNSSNLSFRWEQITQRRSTAKAMEPMKRKLAQSAVEKHRGAKICFFVIICSLGFVAYGSSD
jgi:hypothetical protein